MGIGVLLVGAGFAAGVFGLVPRIELDATVDTTDYTGSPALGEALSEPPRLGPVPEGTFHEVRLDAVNRQIQIADEASLTAWTIGGTVPGPTLRKKDRSNSDTRAPPWT